MGRCRSSTLRLIAVESRSPASTRLSTFMLRATFRGCLGLAPLHPLPDCVLAMSGRTLDGLSYSPADITICRIPRPADIRHYCRPSVRIFTAS